MNPYTNKAINFMVLLFAIIFNLSCSKDADLLTEYVIAESNDVLIEIKVITVKNEPVVIEPLIEITEGTVTEVTEPDMGTAVVNEDNSITYTPNSNATGTDEFDYSTTEQTGTITVTTVNSKVEYWEKHFDIAWGNPSTKSNAFGMAKAMDYALSGGNSQEYYYMAWQLDGVIQIWQATGQNQYLEDALKIIETCIAKATDIKGGKYKGWKVTDLNNDDYAKNGSTLYESYLWRFVATLLRIMHESPELRTMGNYQQRYDTILDFTKVNIWEKWYTKTSQKSDIYRVNAHMSSHWARIGMELFIITGESEYKKVFDNISYAGLPNYSGSSLRGQLKSNSKVPSAYSWISSWGGSRVQDTSHGADIVSFWVNAYENELYWSSKDMKALVSTLNDVVWTSNTPLKFTANIDGSGGSNEFDAGFHGLITLGRFDENLQNRIKNYYSTATVRYKTSQAFGVAALNRKILDDGKPVYPENY